MKSPIKQADRHVDAVLAAMAVLDCFLTKPVLGVKEIMDLTGFTRNRVMRLTGTLLQHGSLMIADPKGGFAVGPKCLALGKVFERSQGFLVILKPVLKQLVLVTGESTSFYVREGLERYALAREEGSHNIRYSIREGQRVGLFAGSASKLILAYLSPEALSTILNGSDLDAQAPKTPAERKEFLKKLEQIRQQGYAVSVGERDPDAFGISAPVFDSENDLVGALCIGGPISRFTDENCQHCLRHIRDEATKLSRQLGWKGLIKQVSGE
jgi:DNA-binding IclR family transcriptional regulator